jgi:hypothetical protein
MQRNIEVQNENRAVKEEMDEMERELVNAKMSHAEVSFYGLLYPILFIANLILADSLRPRFAETALSQCPGDAEQ